MIYDYLLEKSERSREIGIFDEGSEPINTVVEIVVAEAHGRVVEHIAELKHRLVFEEGVPLLDAICYVIFILFHLDITILCPDRSHRR